jgi:hypothetical protein
MTYVTLLTAEPSEIVNYDLFVNFQMKRAQQISAYGAERGNDKNSIGSIQSDFLSYL